MSTEKFAQFCGVMYNIYLNFKNKVQIALKKKNYTITETLIIIKISFFFNYFSLQIFLKINDYFV